MALNKEPSRAAEFPWLAIAISFFGACLLIVLVMFAFPSERVQQTEIEMLPSGAANADSQQMLAMEEAVQTYKLIVLERGLSSCTPEIYPVGELVAACKQTVSQCVREAERAFRLGDGKQHSVDLAAAAYERCFLPTMTRNMTPGPAPEPDSSGAGLVSDPTAPFLAWVKEHWSAPEKAGKDPECYVEPNSDAGWCDRWEFVGDNVRLVRWYKTVPAAVAFTSELLPKARQILTCDALSGKEIRRWTWKHAAGKHSDVSHCQLTTEPLAGQQLWIKNAPLGTALMVFSAEYLKYDRDFAESLRTQGLSQ